MPLSVSTIYKGDGKSLPAADPEHWTPRSLDTALGRRIHRRRRCAVTVSLQLPKTCELRSAIHGELAAKPEWVLHVLVRTSAVSVNGYCKVVDSKPAQF